MLFQATIELNFGMSLIEAIVSAFALYFIARFLNNNLLKEDQVSNKLHKFSSFYSTLVTFVIILGVRLLLESISHYYIMDEYYIFRYLLTDLFLFAIMATIFLPFHGKFLKRISNTNLPDDANNIQNEQFKRLFVRFLILAWIVGAIFLSFPLLQIPLVSGDIYYLGFVWALFVVGIAIIITSLVNKARPIETRIPSFVLKQAMYTGGLISFVIWSIQLIVFELYLKMICK